MTENKSSRNLTRKTSVYSLQNCKFATLEKKDYQEILLKHESRLAVERIKFFHSLPLFNKMGKKVIERLYNTMEKRICLRGQVLAR